MTTNPNEVSQQPMQGLAAYLRYLASTLPIEADAQIKTFRQWALEVEATQSRSATSDAARLDFVCNSPARYVEHSKNGMYRVYQDHAAPDAENALWVAMTVKYYATAREAIAAAMAAGGGQNG